MTQRITLLALLASVVWAPTIDPVTGPAGVYTVTTKGPTRVTSGEGWVRIEWGVEPVVPEPPNPAKPDPPPVVTPPTPPAPPTPAVSLPVLTGQVWMLAVYDSAKADSYPPGQQAVLLPPDKGGSASIRAALKAMSISWQPRTIDDPVLTAGGTTNPDGTKKDTWKDDVLKQTLPCILVIGNAGKTSFVVPLPADEAGVLGLAKKIRGLNGQGASSSAAWTKVVELLTEVQTALKKP